jgi:hypothetical protein
MLGGMAQELDSQALQRMQEYYHEMSDGELLGIATKPDDLTDMAREVMRGEMAHRGLELEDAPSDPFTSKERDRLPKPEFGTKLPNGMVVLTTFYDAIAAGEACDWLEGEGIEVDVRDVSEKSTGGGSFYGGPPVAMQVIVAVRDRDQAVKILREKMGMFPVQEVEDADPVVDDGTVATLGDFGRREDADEVVRVLEEARIWHRVTANPEGSAADENEWTLEVREVDLVRAGELVEKAMELPEG